ncbi:MAG: hypothetical protein ACRC7J_10690 [Vibrio ordalii]|uniref:hypothetical protein n=1 Tax=Vibrio ordalii TaxID=28174 RepID=UPI003F39218C
MITRTNQTVLESRLITSVPTDDSKSCYQVRCLYAGDDLARFIVIDSTDVQKYQVEILAEARFSFKQNHLAFKSQSLTGSITRLLKSKIYNFAQQELGRIPQAF